MMTITLVVGLLILVGIAFLMGTSYTDHNRDRENRRLAAAQRSINARLCPRPEQCQHCRHMLLTPARYPVLIERDFSEYDD